MIYTKNHQWIYSNKTKHLNYSISDVKKNIDTERKINQGSASLINTTLTKFALVTFI